MCRFLSGAVGTEKVVNSDLLSSSGDNSETEDGGQRPAEVEEGDGRHQLMKKGQLSAIGDQLDINKLNQQPMTNAGSGGCGRLNNPNRYRLHFESESREEMERRKRLAKSKTVKPLPDVSFMNGDSTSSRDLKHRFSLLCLSPLSLSHSLTPSLSHSFSHTHSLRWR